MAELSGLVAKQIKLPPGFRFHPTDQELVTHYLSAKVFDSSFIADAVGQVDLNKVEPWDLPWKAKMGEKEWYFFCLRDRKYSTGLRTNRATDAGYWKATGKDKEIFRANSILIGMKKTLVFYGGRAPRGEKTDWIMHEYRLEGKNSLRNLPKTAHKEWVVCRIFKKISGGNKLNISSGLVKKTDSGPDSTSSDENHTTRLIGTELFHATCFSSPMEGHIRDLMHELSASPLRNSDSSSQTLVTQNDLHHPDSHALIQDQSKSGFSIDKRMNADVYSVFSEDEFKPFEDQDFDPTTTSLDCIWDF